MHQFYATFYTSMDINNWHNLYILVFFSTKQFVFFLGCWQCCMSTNCPVARWIALADHCKEEMVTDAHKNIWGGGGGGGEAPETTEIWTHICSCHNFFPLSSVQILLIPALLLIVCALRWYVKSLYMHLFLEEISKHARVTQKMALSNLWQT